MKNDRGLEVALPVQRIREAQEVFFRSFADWAAEIKQMAAQRRTNTIELGKLVCAAKCELRFGQWSQFWRSSKLFKLPFGKRHGEKLVVIGNGLGHLNANSCSHLPTAFRILYPLAQLDTAVLADLIGRGKIHPALTFDEAKALLVLHKPESRGKSKRPQVKRRLSNLRKFIQGTLDNWTPEERETARLAFLEFAEEMAGYKNAAAPHVTRSADFQSINICQNHREPREFCSDREPSRFAARSLEESHGTLQASSHVRSAADGDRPRPASVAA
ncbi:MAG: hypothetical protein L0Z50_38145, partial [Verrucomicrobiales bacterium]|nr:hypothetical protein [Verrucomicrobiales bacterium]